MLYQVIKTEVNRPVVCGFMLIRLVIGLCLMFTVRNGATNFIYLVLFLLLTLGFLKYSSSERGYVLQFGQW